MSIDEKTLAYKHNWVYCPYCGSRLIPYGKDTVIKNYELFCRSCKHLLYPTIENGKLTLGFKPTL